MRVGITGHQRLADPSAWAWVQEELDNILSEQPRPLIGLTSLAVGTDQLFADAILKQGGTFKAFIPYDEYELKFAEGAHRSEYIRLLKLASRVEVLKKATGREAYFQAGKIVVNMSELLIAV